MRWGVDRGRRCPHPPGPAFFDVRPVAGDAGREVGAGFAKPPPMESSFLPAPPPSPRLLAGLQPLPLFSLLLLLSRQLLGGLPRLAQGREGLLATRSHKLDPPPPLRWAATSSPPADPL